MQHTEFPLLAKQASGERPKEEEEMTINGAKILFDVEAELMPVNLQVQNEKHEPK